jgi:hypothetical protein
MHARGSRLSSPVCIHATFLIAQGRLTETEPYAVRALDLRRRVAGEDDDRTLYALAGLGKLRIAQRRWHEAYDWFAKGVEGCRRTQNRHQVCARLFALRASSEAQLRDFSAAHADLAEAESRQREFGGKAGSGRAIPAAGVGHFASRAGALAAPRR